MRWCQLHPLVNSKCAVGGRDFAKGKQCECAVAGVIKKLLWGDDDAQEAALNGLDRYINGEGVYSAEGELTMLQRKAAEPLAFWRHVSRSTLECDVVFATEIAIPLVCAFANQSASERTNKYMVDCMGDKKRTGLDLNKAAKTLDLKVHQMYQKARRNAEEAEQRRGERSVAADLRNIYVESRDRAREEIEVKQRLRELRHELSTIEVEDEEPMINEADAGDVLREDDESEAPLVVPAGFVISLMPPSAVALEFARPASESSQALEGRRIIYKWEGIGWCIGTIVTANDNQRRSINGRKVIFEPHVGEVALRRHSASKT